MKTGMLLEELIYISQASKTDFALSMNMTPSGLSKILKGGRLPFLKEKRAFSKLAASYFAETIYGDFCYLKLERIFPVLYDFSSKYELEMFLSYAIEYAFDKDFDEENKGSLGYPDSEFSFLGKKTILNMFCILVSDYLTREEGVPMELYSTLPWFDKTYGDILSRIKLLTSKRQKDILLNQFVEPLAVDDADKNYDINVLSSIINCQKSFDLNLWRVKKEINSTFFFLKGRFLMLFSFQIDGTPLMTFITHKGYMTSFYNSLMKREAKKVSYNGLEAREALKADPTLLSKLFDRKIDAVYNFISIGYLITEQELEQAKSEEYVKKSLLSLFRSILDKETVFYVTIDAMLGFCATGKAIVPLVGAIDFPSKERISYLTRFNTSINDQSSDKIKVVNSELPKAAFLCSKGFSLIYMIDSKYESEKIHFFETNMINDILKKEVDSDGMILMDFSLDLWESYLDEMSGSFAMADFEMGEELDEMDL
ncbi:hypothetical protein [Lacrimispora sp.]|uniref:hypothetical protein n=1 Tax=Lacrimispora sp. TaxID=2719234 RepID=UPI0034606E1D